LDDYRQNDVSQSCRSTGTPVVYVSEYTLRTRVQIAAANLGWNLLRRVRTYLWLRGQEKQRRAALRAAAAVQCNGMPTYDAYDGVIADRLLYFDTRLPASVLATREEVEQRCAGLLSGEPLRLVFSGRLVRIKGADHLPRVAEALRRLGVPFHMFICGGGALAAEIQAKVAAAGLSDNVKMMGTLPFETELVPFVKRNADLFVCCHRQGDPSCTYLETMACGVPIAGYDNEALTALVRQYRVGWTVPMNRPERLAELIATLHRDRAVLRDMAHESLEFARQHTFETTFRTRAAHIRGVAGRLPRERDDQ
jgi:glycosyltransferase involved in cell wall biosynthesis